MISLEGHRARMRERAEHIGAEDMQPQDLIELLLYYTQPRRDTKRQAGELLNEFGSLEGILAADEKSIADVKGIGKGTARWLSSLSRLIDAYSALRGTDKPRISNIARARKYFGVLFRGCTYPAVWQCSLNSGGRLLSAWQIADNASWAESEYLFSALDAALAANADSVIIGQFTPAAGADFGEYDVTNTNGYASALSAAGIRLLDHMLVRPDGMVSMFATGQLDNEKIQIRGSRLGEDYLKEDIGDEDDWW